VNGQAGGVGSQMTLASGALLRLNADGTFDYDPNGQFEALIDGQTDNDSFDYKISDGNGGTDTATVTVTITGADEGPDEGLIVTILEDNTNPDGEVTLREALAFADAQPGADTITFAPGLAGGVISLLDQLDANSDVTIDGDTDNDGTPDITLDANADGDGNPATALAQAGPDFQPRRVLDFGEDVEATVEGLVITGGATMADASDGRGGRGPAATARGAATGGARTGGAPRGVSTSASPGRSTARGGQRSADRSR
jgi:VCBS repeat-containing protein